MLPDPPAYFCLGLTKGCVFASLCASLFASLCSSVCASKADDADEYVCWLQENDYLQECLDALQQEFMIFNRERSAARPRPLINGL